MKYCWKCPVCGEQSESGSRRVEDQVIHEHFNHAVIMRRDYQAEQAQVDRFSLRQDVRGTRKHRADPLSPDEAHKANQEKMAR